ncbi:MAG: tRNA pseudouridine(38-40) synthase TruA [bacterium]
MEKFRNIKLTIAYDGTNYYGWQRQKDKPTVAGMLESAIFKVCKERVKILGAGRIDKGAHALAFVATFKTISNIPILNIKNALNSFLPYDIIIKDISEVGLSFNPRHCKEKRYRYIVLNDSCKSPMFLRYSYFFPKFLDIEMMRKAANVFIGKKDFSSFVRQDGRNCIREIKSIVISSKMGIFSENLIFFDIAGVSFLYNMIRCIVATLIRVGSGLLNLDDVSSIILAKDRRFAPWIVPSQGLFLVGIDY